MTCKYCGKENRDDAKICKSCGKPLQAAEKEESRPKDSKSKKNSRRPAASALPQLPLILLAVAALALILGLMGTLRGCSAAKAAEEAKAAAAAAQDAAVDAQAAADQNARVLQQALGRIEELESAQVAAPTTPVTTEPTEPMEVVHRYPATDPTVALTVAVGQDGKVLELSYTDANGASVRLEPGAAGVPTSYVLNDTDELVGYDSDIDVCARCTAEANGGYTAQITYRWQSLGTTDTDWVPRPDKTEPCLTVSPGYWYSTRSQYRCEIIITVLDGTGAETDEVSVFTNAVDYDGWGAYAEAHGDEHDVFIQWSDMMKTYN